MNAPDPGMELLAEGVAGTVAVVELLADGTRVQRVWFIDREVLRQTVERIIKLWGEPHVQGMVTAETSVSIGEELLRRPGVTIIGLEEEMTE